MIENAIQENIVTFGGLKYTFKTFALKLNFFDNFIK